MKTSNRILLIFFINIFLLPICLFIGFSSMIRKGNYTLKKFNENNQSTGSLKSGHIVKLVGSNRELVCNIHYMPGKIQWSQSGNVSQGDSISVTNVGDTIIVKYIGNADVTGMSETLRPYNVNLVLPELSKLIVENGQVNVISVDSTRPQKIEADITGNGILNLGGGIVDGFGVAPDNRKLTKGFNVDQLIFQTANGQLEIAKGVQINSLQLQVTGNAAVKVEPGASVKEITGEVSQTTQINANWQTVKQIIPLVK